MSLLPLYNIWRRKAKNEKCDKSTIEKNIRNAIDKIPFYNGYKNFIAEGFDVKKLPVIRKKDIVGKEHLLINKCRWRFLLNRIETGGSTGVSLSLANSFFDNLKQKAFNDNTFAQIGTKLNIAELRGRKPKCGITQRVSRDRVLFSSYLLNANTLDEYIADFVKCGINCIHAYPSSLVVFARLIKNKYGNWPGKELKGIVTSSEIFSKEDKKFVREVFKGVKIIDIYGHNEMACYAISIDDGFYKFSPEFGYVEFIDTGDVINGNRIAEIVATSMMNTTMPLIRYATDDYAELDKDGNVVSIIGRTSDFVVNKMGELAPCIVNTRTESMQNVLNFQFYQAREGKLTFRIIVNEKHNEREKKLLLEDLQMSFLDSMDCDVAIVTEIPKTRIGKQKRLIQELDLTKFK